MPRVRRSADVTWEGNVARGTGRISAATGAFNDLPYSQPARVGKPDGKTSPEELLAAAHAGCYAMSLANRLTTAGSPPQRLDVHAEVTLDEVEGMHRIVRSEVTARARAAVDRETFDRLAEEADDRCTFSALIKASGEVVIHAELEEGS